MRACLLDCHLDLVPNEVRARFKKAKIGLMRKDHSVFIVVVCTSSFGLRNSSSKQGVYINKFPINPTLVEFYPAAIHFKDIRRTLFVKEYSCDEEIKIMFREIKVILNQDRFRQSEKFKKLLSTIPNQNELDFDAPLKPSRLRIRFESVNDSIHCGNNGDVVMANSTDDKQLNNVTVMFGRDKNGENRITSFYQARQYTKLKSHFMELLRVCGVDRLTKTIELRDRINHLEEIHFGGCLLQTIPKQLESFARSLKVLDMSNNNIDKLPRTFCCKMYKLESLNLSNNGIETIPLEIKFLKKLTDLDLSQNRLRMLPSTFSDLKLLKKLNLSNNRLCQLPAMSDDTNLKLLDISDNLFDGGSDVKNLYTIYPSLSNNYASNDATLDYIQEPIMHRAASQDALCPPLSYNNNNYHSSSPTSSNSFNSKPIPSLFEITLLKIVRTDNLFKLASEESLPRTIVSTIQRDIFKCYSCCRMNILPAYNSTDILDYVMRVDNLITRGNCSHYLNFMRLLCRDCFHNIFN